jgi:hypothetical protein
MVSVESKRARPAEAPERRAPAIPYVRAWKIALRTLHLVATYLLFAEHAMGAANTQLVPALWIAGLSGVAMAFLEAYPSLEAMVQGWGALLLLKLVLLGLVPFYWERRVPLLLAAIVVGGVGSHLPARYRHYSFLHGRVIKPR